MRPSPTGPGSSGDLYRHRRRPRTRHAEHRSRAAVDAGVLRPRGDAPRCSPRCPTRRRRRGCSRSAGRSTSTSRRRAGPVAPPAGGADQRARPRQRRHRDPRRGRGRRRRGRSSATPASTSTTPRCVRSTAGSLFHLPVVTGRARRASCSAALRGRGRAAAGRRRRRHATCCTTWTSRRPHAVGMGNEAWGLAGGARRLRRGRPRADLRQRRVAEPGDGRHRVSLRFRRTRAATVAELSGLESRSMAGGPGHCSGRTGPRRGTSTSTTCTARRAGRRRRATRAIVYVNAAAERRSSAMPAEELVGTDIRESLPLQDNDGRSWWACTDPWGGLAIRTGHRERLLMLARPRRGARDRPLRPPGPRPAGRAGSSSRSRDAEARRRAEANSAALISTVAHELRSPLTSVKGFSSTLLRRWDRFTDDQKRLMLRDHRGRRRPGDPADHRAARHLPHRRRAAAGAPPAGRRRRGVSTGTSSASWPAATSASGSRVDAPDAELPEVWADPDRLDQILANLMENAVRHGDGTVTPRRSAMATRARRRPTRRRCVA